MTRRGLRAFESSDPAFYEALGRAVKVARTELGMSRKELAEAAEVSYAYVADIETGRGRPSSSALIAVAQALGMSPSELLARAEGFVGRMTGEPAAALPPGTPRRWFHEDTPEHPRTPERSSSARRELHRLIDLLPEEDVEFALYLARRALGISS